MANSNPRLSQLIIIVPVCTIILILMAYLAPVAGYETSDGQMEIIHTSTDEHYESASLPIDPAVKSNLAIILVGLTVIAFFTIMEGIGRQPLGPWSKDIALTAHRINGWIFIILAIVIAQYCIRILAQTGYMEDAPVTLHIVLAVPVVLIPLIKLALSRRYRRLYNLLPPLGITLLLLTWTTTALIIAYWYYAY